MASVLCIWSVPRWSSRGVRSIVRPCKVGRSPIRVTTDTSAQGGRASRNVEGGLVADLLSLNRQDCAAVQAATGTGKGLRLISRTRGSGTGSVRLKVALLA